MAASAQPLSPPQTTILSTNIKYHRVAKYFYGGTSPDNLYFGVVDGVTTKYGYWQVRYDDGDVEDWDDTELQKGIQLCRSQQLPSIAHELFCIFDIPSDAVSTWAKRACCPVEIQTNAILVCKFFLFVLERQRCWVRRRLMKITGHPHDNCSWTNSMLLRDYYFCNIYRESDRGTQYFHNEVVRRLWLDHKVKHLSNIDSVDSWKEWFQTVLWAACCYRFVNKIESFSPEGNLPTSKFGRIPTRDNWEAFKELVLRTRKKKKQKNDNSPAFFTNAHQVCGFDDYVLFLDNIATKNSEAWYEALDAVFRNPGSLQEIFRGICKLPGCGNFQSWQILCDLHESNAVPTVKTIDDFCHLGKGAKAGIGEIFFGTELPPNGVKDVEYLRLSKLLMDCQDSFYQPLKSQVNIFLEFPKWRGQSLTLKEIEHALCEFSKWQRIERSVYAGARRPGQRRRKSRSHLDDDLRCQLCSEKLSKATNIMLCITCNQGYHKECLDGNDDGNNNDPLYWMCASCLDLKRFEWSVEQFGDAEASQYEDGDDDDIEDDPDDTEASDDDEDDDNDTEPSDEEAAEGGAPAGSSSATNASRSTPLKRRRC